MRRARLHIGFSSAAFVCFLIATIGFDVAARMNVSGEPLQTALSESLYYKAVQPVGTLMLLAPFIAAGGLSAEVSKAASIVVGAVFFAALLAVLGWLYFDGYWGAQIAMEQQKWTAAALSVGRVPFLSIPVLLIAGMVLGVIEWRYRKRET